MMITLRQIVHRGLEEAFKDEDLVLESELKQLTEYILDNSYIEMTDENIYLGSGNLLGICEENKDKELVLPRFMVFKFKDRDIRNEKSRWNWSLQSYKDLEDLEEILGIYDFENSKRIAIIDNEIVKYECKDIERNIRFGINGIHWEQEMYSVTYKKENIITEERFRSKADLEKYISKLVAENREGMKENINVKNLIENRRLGFSININETIYDGTSADEKDEVNVWLRWKSIEEEGCGWNDDFEDSDFS